MPLCDASVANRAGLATCRGFPIPWLPLSLSPWQSEAAFSSAAPPSALESSCKAPKLSQTCAEVGLSQLLQLGLIGEGQRGEMQGRWGTIGSERKMAPQVSPMRRGRSRRGRKHHPLSSPASISPMQPLWHPASRAVARLQHDNTMLDGDWRAAGPSSCKAPAGAPPPLWSRLLQCSKRALLHVFFLVNSTHTRAIVRV